MKDFLISYHKLDRPWAEWLACQLQEAGHTTVLEAWDFLAGQNLILEMQRAFQEARRVLAVLSNDYLMGDFTQAQWAAAFAQDPTGEKRLLIPVMVKRCLPSGLLGQLVMIDLVGLDEEAARAQLLQALRSEPSGPPVRPLFPGARPASQRPPFPGDPSSLMQRLPLPLARLLARTLNSKSAHERHLNAYCLGEATLKLAASLRIGLWLDRCLEPGGELASTLEALVLPSPADWLECLNRVDQALARRPDAALLPLGPYLGRLGERHEEWPAVDRLVHAVATEGVLREEEVAAARQGGVLGFLSLLVAYRCAVIEVAAPRRSDYCDRFALLLLEALQEVLQNPLLLGGMRLVQARLLLEETRREVTWEWQNLTSPLSVPLRESLGPTSAEIKPGHLYFVGPGAVVPLHPLAVCHEDELGQDAVGFLNKTHRRTRREGQRAIDEILRADYLDYATGENLPGVDAGEALMALLGRLRGQPATAEEVRLAQERSQAASRAEPPAEVVAAGAALGDFELLAKIGEGGMGIIYRARQRSLHRIVALKVLPPTQAADPVVVQRFRREIAALSRCHHPNVIGVLSSGVDSDRYYYAMEYIDGADLGKVARVLSEWQRSGAELREGHLQAAISRSGPRGEEKPEQIEKAAAGGTAERIPQETSAVPAMPSGRQLYVRLAELFADAALGLAHLHQQKIIHRDIKPSNLMLTADGQRVVLMDLGLAKLADASRDLTQGQGHVLGTLRYMAPEQLEGGTGTDPRVDVYGLGACLYELVSGQALFGGETATELRRQVLFEEPRPLVQVAARVPRDLRTIIAVATAKDPARRYATAQAMAADLRAFVENRPIAASPPGKLHAFGLLVRRQPVTTGTVAMVLLLALAGVVGFWRWNRVQVDDFANFVNRWEVPEGIRRVSPREQQHRNATFRLTRRRGRLIKMERINGLGHLANDADGEASWEFFYDEAMGRLHQVVARDRQGRIVLVKTYSSDLRRLERKDEYGKPKPKKGTDISVEMREFDDRGYVRREVFTNFYVTPRPNDEGEFGLDKEIDERGLQKKLISLGSDGSKATTREGLASSNGSYDEWGNIVDWRYLGKDGRPTLTKEGDAGWRARFDGYGNPVEYSYFGIDGKPTLRKNGTAGSRARFDEHGNQVETSYFGIDGKPTLHKDGFAGWHARFDERGNQVETSYFGTDGNPILHKDGFAGWRARFDERGNRVELAYLGTNGKPTLHKNGIAGWYARFDERGNEVEGSYFGIDGKPTLHKDGVAGWHVRFDERGNKVERSFFGTDGKPTLHKDGVAGWRARFDERGNEVERSYFGTDGKPTLPKDGFAGWRARFDERGNEVERSYFGIDGKPTLHKDGFAERHVRLDERGNEVERSYFGIDGKPILDKNGIAGWRASFDERSNQVEAVALGTDGKPILAKNGIAGWHARFDERGNEVEGSYFGIDGKPILNKNGIAGWRVSFDERRNQVEAVNLGTDGKPILSKTGVAGWHTRFNERGEVVELFFFDTDGKPTLHKDGTAGWRARFDERGNQVERSFFGRDGEPVLKDGSAGWRARFDDRDNEIERSFFGTDGKPALKDGFVGWRARFDERGNEVEYSFFGIDGRLTLSSNDGFAGYETVYSAYDRRSREILYDVAGTPIEGSINIDGTEIGWKRQRQRLVFSPPTGFDQTEVTKRVEAHIRGFRMERLRAGRPELFRRARGLLVVSLTPDGQAKSLGMTPGDIIVEYDGHAIDRLEDLMQYATTLKTPSAPVVIVRDSRNVSLDAKPGLLGIIIEPMGTCTQCPPL